MHTKKRGLVIGYWTFGTESHSKTTSNPNPKCLTHHTSVIPCQSLQHMEAGTYPEKEKKKNVHCPLSDIYGS